MLLAKKWDRRPRAADAGRPRNHVLGIGGILTGVASFSIWTVVAVAALAGLLYLLFRKGYQPEGEIHHLTSVAAAATK